MAMQRRRTGSNPNGAAVNSRSRNVYYPSRDGKPMGETDLHRNEMARLISTLEYYYAQRPDVYVSGNLLLYYVEGDPRKVISPDVFVAFGIAKHLREIFKLWEEAAGPAFVIEVTSKSTRVDDLVRKRTLYAQLGVREYFLYDPRFPRLQYLDPPLQGLRLVDGDYRAIEANDDGSLPSEVLGLRLHLVDGLLRFYPNGEPLLSAAERADAEARRADDEARRAASAAERADIEARRAEAEAQRAAAEAEARRAAEQRIAELEALLRERGGA